MCEQVVIVWIWMLEDVFLKIGEKTGRNFGNQGSGQSPSFSRAGSTVIESVASRSFYSLPTNTQSFGSDHSSGDFSRQPYSSLQADAALGLSQTQMTDINDFDSFKTLRQIRCDAQKKGNLYKWSTEGRPNPISHSGSDDGGMCLLKRCWRLPPLRKYLLHDLKIL